MIGGGGVHEGFRFRSQASQRLPRGGSQGKVRGFVGPRVSSVPGQQRIVKGWEGLGRIGHCHFEVCMLTGAGECEHVVTCPHVMEP